MKKKGIIIFCALMLIAAAITAVLLRDDKLPAPSQASLDYIASEFNGLTLDESIDKVQSEKQQFDFFIQMGGNDNLYDKRTLVIPSDDEYKVPYSILPVDEYQQAFNEMITSLSFNQDIYYEYSLITLNIKDMPSKKQPTVKIKKITYMDGSEELSGESISEELKLDSDKTVKSIDVSVTYSYISALDSYHLSADKTDITEPGFTLKLAAVDKNYLSYTRDGDLNIIAEDISDKNGKILSSSSCVRGDVGFTDKMSGFVNSADKVSKKNNKDKNELIYRIATYYEQFEKEINESSLYQVACLFHGTPAAVTVYSVKDSAKENSEITIVPKHVVLYPVVEDEKSKVFYIIDQNGNKIVNNGRERLYAVTPPYFYTEHTEQRKDDDGGEYDITRYRLYKLDAQNKKLEQTAEIKDILKVSDNSFVTHDSNAIVLYNKNNEKPVVFSDNYSRINLLEFDDGRTGFFEFQDKQGYHIINDKGIHILPVTDYSIDNGGDNSLLFSPGFFIEDKINTADKRFYFINPEGNIFLTLNGYDKVYAIKNNMIHVSREKSHGFTDLQGKEVIPLIYEDARDFDNGYALVKKEDHWGVINTQGEVVIPFKYNTHNSRSTSNGLTSYGIDDKDYTMTELLNANGLKTENVPKTAH
ncbi:WG repeat-containing protein [Morganella psychrotolerans]|uniref:WG repeat-containing protein n=1 Tax=Morganella psychrotolerans TaxID=368603 RepID=UPI0039AEF4D2